MQHQMNNASTHSTSVMYSQPHSSQLKPFLPQDQWSQLQQQKYTLVGRQQNYTLVGRSNMEQPSIGTAPNFLFSIPADHMIPSSSVVTTVAIATSIFSTLQSSSYTYSQTTTVDTIMTTVQCGNSSHHSSLYSVCDHPTSMASFQVGP